MKWLKRNKMSNAWDMALAEWAQAALSTGKLPGEALRDAAGVATGTVHQAFEAGLEPDDAVLLGRAVLVAAHAARASSPVPSGFLAHSPADVVSSLRVRYGDARVDSLLAFVDAFGAHTGAQLPPVSQLFGAESESGGQRPPNSQGGEEKSLLWAILEMSENGELGRVELSRARNVSDSVASELVPVLGLLFWGRLLMLYPPEAVKYVHSRFEVLEEVLRDSESRARASGQEANTQAYRAAGFLQALLPSGEDATAPSPRQSPPDQGLPYRFTARLFWHNGFMIDLELPETAPPLALLMSATAAFFKEILTTGAAGQFEPRLVSTVIALTQLFAERGTPSHGELYERVNIAENSDIRNRWEELWQAPF
jgi:hypothetical protein